MFDFHPQITCTVPMEPQDYMFAGMHAFSEMHSDVRTLARKRRLSAASALNGASVVMETRSCRVEVAARVIRWGTFI